MNRDDMFEGERYPAPHRSHSPHNARTSEGRLEPYRAMALGMGYIPFGGWAADVYPDYGTAAMAAAQRQQRLRDEQAPRWEGPLARRGDDGEQGLLERAGSALREVFHMPPKPSDYRRADNRLIEDVSDALADNPYVDAADVTVTVEDGEVTLSGTVSSRWMKRRAEDVAETVRGVQDVHNRLRVVDAG